MFERVRVDLVRRLRGWPSIGSTALILATLALSAHLLARAASDYAAGELQRASRASMAAAQLVGTGEPAPGSVPPDAHEIVKRNVFDPTPPAPALDSGGDHAAAGAGSSSACGGPLRLVAAVTARNAQRSLATVAIGDDEPRMYRPGSRIRNLTLVKVMARAVQLRAPGGKLCTLRLHAEPEGPGAYESEPLSLVHDAAPALAQSELDAAIKAEGGRYTMPRSFVERVLQHQAGAIAGVRAVLHKQDGQVIGVKLYGIRRTSVFGKLGLQNGDLLRTINGFDLTTPDNALDAYAKLRNARHLSLALIRRDRALNLVYAIEP